MSIISRAGVVFSSNELGIHANVCKQYATGKVLYIQPYAQCTWHSARQALWHFKIHTSSISLLWRRTTTIMTQFYLWHCCCHMWRRSRVLCYRCPAHAGQLSSLKIRWRSRKLVSGFLNGDRGGCVFAIAGTQDAITTWVWKCRGVTSRSSASVLLPLGSSLDAYASSSRPGLERAHASAWESEMHSFASESQPCRDKGNLGWSAGHRL